MGLNKHTSGILPSFKIGSWPLFHFRCAKAVNSSTTQQCLGDKTKWIPQTHHGKKSFCRREFVPSKIWRLPFLEVRWKYGFLRVKLRCARDSWRCIKTNVSTRLPEFCSLLKRSLKFQPSNRIPILLEYAYCIWVLQWQRAWKSRYALTQRQLNKLKQMQFAVSFKQRAQKTLLLSCGKNCHCNLIDIFEFHYSNTWKKFWQIAKRGHCVRVNEEGDDPKPLNGLTTLY